MDFVSEAGKTYFVEVASVSGSGLLNLFIRATDIQPPAIAISAPSVLAEPSGTSTFQLVGTVTDTDHGSGVDTSRPTSGRRRSRRTSRGRPPADPIPIAVTPVPGNESIKVEWPAQTGWKAGSGTATVRVWDRAGNMGTARLTLKVRDRMAPKVLKARVIPADRRRRVTLRATCSEPGMLHMEFRNQTRGHKLRRTIDVPIRRAGVVRSATWKRIWADVYLAQWTCKDTSGNTTSQFDNFLFGF